MIYLIAFFILMAFIVIKIEQKIIASKYLIKRAHKYRHKTRTERIERRKEIEEYKKSLTHKYYEDDVTNNYVEISKDSNGSYYKSIESNNENILLSTLFSPPSSLQRENLYSLSLLSSQKILSSSLELEKNKILNNRFYERKVV